MDDNILADESASTSGNINSSTAQMKAMFKELLAESRNDILAQVKDNIDKIYSDFEMVALENEDARSVDVSEPGLASLIDNFVQPQADGLASQDGQSDLGAFKNLAEEFSVSERTAIPISSGLAAIVNGLLQDKLPKEKLAEVQPKYLRPENCPHLVAPKVNKQVWQQMRQETRNTDSALQKAQGLLISGLCAVLEVCNSSDGDKRRTLAHATVLLLSANREFNLRRRDFIRPDLNKQYSSLCNPSIPVSTNLFGDDLNKEVEELTKSNKLSNKVTPKHRSDYRSEPYKVPSNRSFRGRGRFNQTSSREISTTRLYFTFNEAEQTIIDGEIDKFLHKGIIKSSVSESGEVLSPIFITPKKDGSSRVIFNLKGLNEFVSYHHFKMDTLETAIKLMRPGCFMTSIDLKDAYYSIPVASEHQKYLKFFWRDKLYCFTCLPMGLSSSPRIFTKVMKPVFATLRSKFGHTCLGYIDDSLYIEDTYEDCHTATLHAVRLISSLGFMVHPDKSVFIPTQCIEYLGFSLNSVCMTVTLTSLKREKLLLLCQKFQQPNTLHTIRRVASLIGSLVSSFPGVEFGPLHYRYIEADKDYNLKLHQGNFDAEMSLSADSLEEVNWWVNNIPLASRSIYHAPPDVVLYTDASAIGWGAKLSDGVSTSGIWSRDEARKHINFLELQAIHLALLSLLNDQINIHVRIMCDNTTAVTYINQLGGCRSEQCNSLAKKNLELGHCQRDLVIGSSYCWFSQHGC
ncbi:uncharacterized protein LOC114518732 [Dendronephthya gigantea]|uniref:uncharacterized protein LOC114518732 n=1 Tax=Dendronephthya gigantea TaxID=151771 RepID=UPI00106CAF6C|nr:uncharacterized protein LOC114518732 [Dendronephthya gigantea]